MALTHAEFGRFVASLVRDAAATAAGLADGMHNPNFAAADATQDAQIFVQDISARLEHLRSRIAS